MSRKYEREDWLGNKYWEDEEGNRTYEHEDWLGHKYYEKEGGSRAYEREDWLGNTYREDEEGRKEYEREDWLGNRYREDEEGNRTYEREGWLGNRYEEKEDKGGGCFLTSACVEFHGLPDDCAELRALRAFRDRFVARLPNGHGLIAEYYRTAPRILKAIELKEDPSAVMNWIYGEIRHAVELIKREKPETALRVYESMYLKLKTGFLERSP